MKRNANGQSSRARPRVACTSKARLFRLENGQSLVEVALVAPILLALVLGAVEMGRFAYLGIMVGNAARAGAAYGSQSLPQSKDTANICNSASFDFQGSAVACSGTTSTGSNGTITVTSSVACGCDNAGNDSLASTTCSASTGGTCSSGQNWVVVVTVNASGQFSSLFNFPGIPSSITVSRSSTMRVAQQ